MARKGENIYKRKDGRWEARYIKSHDLSGKSQYGYCYGKTYREAKEKAMAARLSLLNHAPTQPKRDKRRFFVFCDEWLALQRSEVRGSTYVKYCTILEKHIKPRLGNCYPLALSTQTVEDFKWALLDADGLSPKTVKDVMVVLRSVVGYTAKQFPGSFPSLEFHYPKPDKKEMSVLTVAEQRKLTSYLLADLDDCKRGVLLALLTGMRLGELCVLKWENVSLTERTIRVCATVQRLRNTDADTECKTKLWVGKPKSDSSCRMIPLSDSAVALCRKAAHRSPNTYVLTGTQEPMEPRTLQYRFEKYTRDCGLEGVHFHTLRHTFATRCVEVGFELKSLSEVLGHANTSITLDRYVHPSLDLKLENMNKLAMLPAC